MEKKFLPTINDYKFKTGIKDFNKYWLDYYIKTTKTTFNCGKFEPSIFYSIEFYLKGIKQILDDLVTQYPEILGFHGSEVGLNMLKLNVPVQNVLAFKKCFKCAKTDVTTGYFYCRVCRI